MKSQQPPPELLTIREAAEYLRVSVSAFQRYLETGRISYYGYTEKTRRFRRQDLERFLRESYVPGRSEKS